MDKDNNNIKQVLVNSFIKFLNGNRNNFSEDQRETIDVAVQCLDAVFNITDREEELPVIDLLELISNRENEAAIDPVVAEQHKISGNNAMQRAAYETALYEYTLAIQHNPNNAVYHCNRAAAFTRLNRNEDAIRDCKNAIRLDPHYGKAYGRLGIAYSNLAMYAEACEAYQQAIQAEPNNQVYHQNLMIAQQQLAQQQQQPQQQQPQQQQQQEQPQQAAGAAGSANGGPNRFSGLFNNENLLQVFSQAMNSPEFANMMVDLANEPGAPSLDVLLQLGSVLANQLQQSNPGLANNIRSRFTISDATITSRPEPRPVGDGNPEEEDNGDDDEDEDDDNQN